MIYVYIYTHKGSSESRRGAAAHADLRVLLRGPKGANKNNK